MSPKERSNFDIADSNGKATENTPQTPETNYLSSAHPGEHEAALPETNADNVSAGQSEFYKVGMFELTIGKGADAIDDQKEMPDVEKGDELEEGVVEPERSAKPSKSASLKQGSMPDDQECSMCEYDAPDTSIKSIEGMGQDDAFRTSPAKSGRESALKSKTEGGELTEVISSISDVSNVKSLDELISWYTVAKVAQSNFNIFRQEGQLDKIFMDKADELQIGLQDVNRNMKGLAGEIREAILGLYAEVDAVADFFLFLKQLEIISKEECQESAMEDMPPGMPLFTQNTATTMKKLADGLHTTLRLMGQERRE